jgi:pyrimidine-nucleoside phosphorylase
MRTVDVIIKKRDGETLSADEIQYMVNGCVAGEIPDYQMSAWLMAIFFRGMSFVELAALTQAMVHSGEVYDLSSIPAKKVDKHSTGGVGDKVSLVLAPLVAAAGVPVPMVAGRGLGHTGGTLDKIEAIPGFRVRLDGKAFRNQIERIGVAIIGQSECFVPADRKLYALRDVTGTVESIPLISASIMSKKTAAGINALVMDVKTGNGAFMSDPDDAMRLARTLVAIGREVGLPVVVLLTDMNQPLGRAVGNAVEVAEALDTLMGAGPNDLREIVLAVGAEMLVLGGVADSVAPARAGLLDCLKSGKGLEKFTQMVASQGGDPRVVENRSLLGLDGVREEVLTADRAGVVEAFDTRRIGIASMVLGAGRKTVDEKVDHAVGLCIEKKIGESVGEGEVLCRILYRNAERMKRARDLLDGAITLGNGPVAPPQLIKSRLDGADLRDGKGG